VIFNNKEKGEMAFFCGFRHGKMRNLTTLTVWSSKSQACHPTKTRSRRSFPGAISAGIEGVRMWYLHGIRWSSVRQKRIPA
jgi:hypothetical protein